MYTNIWNALKTILDGLVATTKINVVYNYDKTQHSSLPAVTISPIDTTEVLFASDRNMVDINYRIRCVDDAKGLQETENNMRSIADAILRELRLNPDLNGTVCLFDVNVVWGWVWDEQPYRSFDINLICKVYPTFV